LIAFLAMGIIPQKLGEKLRDAGSEPASSFGLDEHTRDQSRLVGSAGEATANSVINGVDVGKRNCGAKQRQQSMLKIRTQTNRAKRQLMLAVTQDRLPVDRVGLVLEVVKRDTSARVCDTDVWRSCATRKLHILIMRPRSRGRTGLGPLAAGWSIVRQAGIAAVAIRHCRVPGKRGRS
jgi:hypothetical protein